MEGFVNSEVWERFLNAPVLFGLEAQGHIPTIKNMLAEGKSWDEIGAAIGWIGYAAKEAYERYTERQGHLRDERPCDGVGDTPPSDGDTKPS